MPKLISPIRAVRVRLTARDYSLIQLVCEQGVVGTNDLDYALSTAGEPISPRTRNGVLLRLRKAGLVETNRWTYRGGSVVTPTRLGAGWVGWKGRIDRPGAGVVNHDLTVSAVRIHQYCAQETEFLSERAIQHLEIDFGLHRPDGIVETVGERTAVEVQLTHVGRPRFAEVIGSHLQHFEHIDYWCSQQAKPGVERTVMESVPDSEKHRIRVLDLGGLQR